MRLALLAAAIAAIAAPVLAADPSASDRPMTERTEKLKLKPHRVPGLLLGYGYTLGEFTGEVRARSSSTRAPLFSSDGARTTFTFGRTGDTAAPVTVSCNGGQSRFALGWIEFDRDDLQYVCTFDGGPPDAAFALALAKGGGLLARMADAPPRAAEIMWGGADLQARSRRNGGAAFLLSAPGSARTYIISHDGREVAGIVPAGLQPNFYLPPAGDPDREAAAMMALALFFFSDPADR